MHLKKNSSGHLLKNSSGHLADSCGSTENYKYEVCHENECYSCGIGKYPSIYLTISWTDMDLTKSLFPYCETWYNGEKKEICPDVYSYTAATTSAPGSEKWEKNGLGTNPGVYLRLANNPTCIISTSSGLAYAPTRGVKFRLFGAKLKQRKGGTTASQFIEEYNCGGSYCAYPGFETENFDPNNFTLNASNEYIQDPSFGQVTTTGGVTYKWERGNQTAPTYATKVFATNVGASVKISGVCYGYVGTTTDAVNAIPGDIDTDGVYTNCLSCTENFVYKKCVKCGCTTINTDPTIYVTLSWSGGAYETKTAFGCDFRNGERKELCASYYGQPTGYGETGESWFGGGGLNLVKKNIVFYYLFTSKNMTAYFNISGGTWGAIASFNKNYNTYFGSQSNIYFSQVASNNINLSTWVANSTPFKIEDKQFGSFTTTSGVTVKWERGRFWDGVGFPEEEKVFDRNMGDVIMINGECWSIIRVDSTTVNASRNEVQDSFSTCALCEKDSSSSSSSSSEDYSSSSIS